MPNTQLNTIKKKVLQFFAKHPKETFKPHTLARRLSLKGLDEFRVLSQALNELYQEKAIERRDRKRYGHAPPPQSQRLRGVLKAHPSGTATVRLLPPSEGTM